MWLFTLTRLTSGAESVLLYSVRLDHHHQASKLFCVYLRNVRDATARGDTDGREDDTDEGLQEDDLYFNRCACSLARHREWHLTRSLPCVLWQMSSVQRRGHSTELLRLSAAAGLNRTFDSVPKPLLLNCFGLEEYNCYAFAVLLESGLFYNWLFLRCCRS